MELWQLAASELQTSGGVIDMAMPKTRAEFLATGYAYTHHQQEKTAVMARVDIDNLSKSLVVFGDRFWSGSKMTPPQPFGDMRLDWTRAWGVQAVKKTRMGWGFARKIIRDKASTACRTLSPSTGA
jgi:hypothetical protein